MIEGFHVTGEPEVAAEVENLVASVAEGLARAIDESILKQIEERNMTLSQAAEELVLV